jgi:hypothetical protein
MNFTKGTVQGGVALFYIPAFPSGSSLQLIFEEKLFLHQSFLQNIGTFQFVITEIFTHKNMNICP